MTEEEKQAAADAEAKAQAEAQTNETIKKLEDQVENLNKGIAASRDEAKKAIEAAKAATEALDQYKQDRKNGDEPEVELSADEEKKFEAWAKANGVVTQAELAAEREKRASESAKDIASTAVSEFLEKHPEFDNDEAWAKVQEEFNLYKTPTDLAGYRKLLERVRKDLSGDDKETARARARAEISKRENLSKGGGGQGGTAGGSQEAEIDKLQDKYPNLSREQIEARLSEISSLYPKEK